MGEKGDTSQATGGLGERMVRQSDQPAAPAAPATAGGDSGWGLSDVTDAMQDQVTDSAGGAISGLRGKDDDKNDD